MLIARSIALFILAAVSEIGGAWLIGKRERASRAGLDRRRRHRSRSVRVRRHPAAGRQLRADPAAYGGVFVAGSLAWGMIVDRFRPDRYDIIGALICLVGVGVIMYFPRSG